MGKYDDIIGLPHHISKTHTPMPRADRAAQFAPFAALTGYDAAVKEEARLTRSKIELTEEEITRLNEKIAYLNHHIDKEPIISITYFLNDKRKTGGAYVTDTDAVRRIDEIEGAIILKNKKKIVMTDIFNIESELFQANNYEEN